MHDVLHEIEVAEGHARLHAVDGDAAVRAQNVVHMQLAHALARLFPERLGGGREVGVFVPEQLVGDLPVSRTRTSEISCIFLQTRYMPTEARTVVMSKVPMAAMT